jgi:hypothetical protein
MERMIIRTSGQTTRNITSKEYSKNFKLKQMKLLIIFLSLYLLSANVKAQKRPKEFSLAVMNVQSAMPFGKFAGMFSGQFHPGAEAGIGFNWITKAKHDWFQEIKAGYFFHRFVQHGIPVYTNIGYRYKFSSSLSSKIILGAGYLHSIPAAAKLKLNDKGEYINDKGVGRMQAMAITGLGVSYKIKTNTTRPVTIFAQYQQLVQLPFIKSYVPLLPYNSFEIGISRALISKKSK